MRLARKQNPRAVKRYFRIGRSEKPGRQISRAGFANYPDRRSLRKTLLPRYPSIRLESRSCRENVGGRAQCINRSQRQQTSE